MVRAMCEVQFRNRKRTEDLMLMFSLNETIDQLAMANSVDWYGHVLRKEDSHVLRRALHLEDEGKSKKERSKKTWKSQAKEERVKLDQNKKGVLC